MHVEVAYLINVAISVLTWSTISSDEDFLAWVQT